MTLTEMQNQAYANKVAKGFNVTDVSYEFCHIYGEMAEAFEAWRKKKDDLGEELADVMIYLLGISEIVGVNLEDEVMRKLLKNKNREYERVDGVLRKKEG